MSVHYGGGNADAGNLFPLKMAVLGSKHCLYYSMQAFDLSKHVAL
jgi:hypothetical protein